MDRVFLDGNVVFSAAWRADSGLHRLWRLKRVRLVSSEYAIEEARRNLPDDCLARFAERIAGLEAADTIALHGPGAEEVRALPDKDQPILLAAIGGACTHLLTGDVTRFGAWFGKRLAGVLIMRPVEYLRSRAGTRRSP